MSEWRADRIEVVWEHAHEYAPLFWVMTACVSLIKYHPNWRHGCGGSEKRKIRIAAGRSQTQFKREDTKGSVMMELASEFLLEHVRQDAAVPDDERTDILSKIADRYDQRPRELLDFRKANPS